MTVLEKPADNFYQEVSCRSIFLYKVSKWRRFGTFFIIIGDLSINHVYLGANSSEWEDTQ